MSLASSLATTLALILPLSFPCFSQQRAERTIDEIKTEAIHRAEVGQYPLIGLDAGDVKEAFNSIHTRDKDEWAAGFTGVADRYMNEAKSLEKTDPVKANADYIRAWRLYSFGRWPIPASAGKQRSYEKAIEAFLAHARFWDPPLEIVARGRDAVASYFRELGTDALPLNELKVLLVGNGAAGKTSLVKRMFGDTFDADEPQTHGINIRAQNIKTLQDNEAKLNFWDFGGQEIMHATHQFFLSRRSLYIIVLAGRAGQKGARAAQAIAVGRRDRTSEIRH